MIAVAAWLAALCGLVVAAAIATARARTRPDDIVERGWFVALAIAHLVLAAGAVWTWGGARATEARDDRLREGAQVALELRGVDVPVAKASPVVIGHARDATVRLPGTGSDVVARVELGRADASAVVQLDCQGSGQAVAMPPGATLPVTECGGIAPAFTVRFDGSHLAVAPARAARTFVAAGDVLRLGRTDEPIPGLSSWELPAPGSELLAIPSDPTDCAAWPGAAHAIDGGCLLALGAFRVAAVPLVPDAAAMTDRAERAALVIATPLTLACCILACLPRSRRRAPTFAQLARVGALGAGLVALACWRLVWAYRIDVLRDLSHAGPRLADNELAAALIAATLAGLATRRVLHAVVAWTVTAALGFALLRLAALDWTHARIAAVGLSLIASVAPRASELARRLPRIGPDVVLIAIASAATVAKALGPHGVLAKLALAYALVLAGHAALRLALSQTTLLHRLWLLATLGVAAAAVARYDTGVALAIGGVGLALSMLLAGHDASYDASVADRIGLLEREHARLVAMHGAIALVVAVVAMLAAAFASDRDWLERAAPVACQAPIVAAVMFAIAAVLARVHGRAWLPHVAAAVAAIALWGARGDVLERATAGHGVASDRVAAVVDPGYALLRDQRRFAATAAAWREAALPDCPEAIESPGFAGVRSIAARRCGGDIDRVDGEGLFGAHIVDPGVIHSVENDYLPVLVARETGVAGIAATTALLIALVAMAGTFAVIGSRHASRGQRGRWLVAVVLGALAVYQPLASLGVLPLTGISWPGLGIDSPSDLWLFVIALAWCAFAEPEPSVDDERVRATRRVMRARRIAIAALAASALAGGVVVARSAAMALSRVPAHDARLAAALRYASTLRCPWNEQDGAPGDVVPEELGGDVGDVTDPATSGTQRFDRELRDDYRGDRDALLAALPACAGEHGHWQLAKAGSSGKDACVATFREGTPELHLELAPRDGAWHASCAVAVPDIAASALRGPLRGPRGPRVRVVSAPIGASERDAGELIAGAHIIRLRDGAAVLDLGSAAVGLSRAGGVALVPGVSIAVAGKRVSLHGDAELYLASDGAWRHVAHAPDVALDHLALVAAGPPEHRVVVQVRPAAEPLLADDVEHARRTYPYGSAVPELGWVSPFAVEHSLGLDGWIHAALREPAASAASCGTLAPPPIAHERVCAPSPLDGVLECKLALQPELAIALAGVADQAIAKPEPVTGHAIVPTRLAYVVLRGDTGELLAQGEQAPGKLALAYAPVDRDAEAELIKLREERGEGPRERVEWNLPIAVGSTFKPILARAAERAFPDELHALALTAAGHASGCRAHHGVDVDPLLGHCPPSSLAGELTFADTHDYLAKSQNWFQAALGLIGLGIGDGHFHRGKAEVSLADIEASDLASWSTKEALAIEDATGPIVRGHSIVIDGVRRTPLWRATESLLGRPLCTLGDRASCERAADRADVCAARALPIAHPSRDLRYLVALGPDRLDVYADDKAQQSRVPITEYFQLLRGAGVHPLGSLAQLADAFARVVYGGDDAKLAASWFPAPAVGKLPGWSCADASASRTNAVLGAGGGLCGVVQAGGTAYAGVTRLTSNPRVTIYGAKTGTTDSLVVIAQHPAACAAWNATHPQPAQLTCGKRPPDDSLLVLAFGVATPHGTVPLVLALQLQRAGMGAAAHAAPVFVDAVVRYLTE